MLAQEGIRVDPIVVANGSDCDPDLLGALARRPDIRLLHRDEPGLASAISAGRDRVDAPYFAELDDDDWLLPGGLATRVARMVADPVVDVVVSKGFLRGRSGDVLNLPDIARCAADPLGTLMDQNWLVPCAGLYRTATIPAAFFRAMPAYLEWTYLAVQLALSTRIAFLDTPTFVYSEDTPRSLSKSREYSLHQPGAIKRVLQLPVPPPARRRLHRKYVAALHSASMTELRQGQKRAAWRWHLRTLMHPYGWRYLTYTRHLLT